MNPVQEQILRVDSAEVVRAITLWVAEKRVNAKGIMHSQTDAIWGTGNCLLTVRPFMKVTVLALYIYEKDVAHEWGDEIYPDESAQATWRRLKVVSEQYGWTAKFEPLRKKRNFLRYSNPYGIPKTPEEHIKWERRMHMDEIRASEGLDYGDDSLEIEYEDNLSHFDAVSVQILANMRKVESFKDLTPIAAADDVRTQWKKIALSVGSLDKQNGEFSEAASGDEPYKSKEDAFARYHTEKRAGRRANLKDVATSTGFAHGTIKNAHKGCTEDVCRKNKEARQQRISRNKQTN